MCGVLPLYRSVIVCSYTSLYWVTSSVDMGLDPILVISGTMVQIGGGEASRFRYSFTPT